MSDPSGRRPVPPVRRSAQHQLIKDVRRLSGRRTPRESSGRFLIEGPGLVAEAIAAGVIVEHVVVPDDERGHRAAADISIRLAAAGSPAEVVSVEPGVFQGLAAVDHPQPAVAVARSVTASLSPVIDAVGRDGGAVIVLAGVADPGNVGTLVRSAEAAGAAAVVATTGTADLWSPKVVRSAAGSIFRLPVVAQTEIDELLGACRAARVRIVALDHRGDTSLDTADLTGPIALVVGSEAHGVPENLRKAAEFVVSIPMAGAVESLNAGVAGSLVLFERARQLRRFGVT